METKIVFIGGTGRCGTNILKDILGLHTDIATLPFEYRFIIDPDGLVDFYNSFETWTPYVIDRRLKRLETLLEKLSNKKSQLIGYKDWELDKHIPEFSEFVVKLINELHTFYFYGSWIGAENQAIQMCYSSPKSKETLKPIIRKFINDVISSILKKQNKKMYVEDNTWNILFAKELLEIMPDAKIIHIYRNPLDVVTSFVKQRWCPSEIELSVKMYADIINRWFEIRKGLPVNSFYEIRFEKLIHNPKETITDICNFIGLPFNKKMLDINLNKHNIGRWRKDLTASEISLLKVMLEDIIIKLNYNGKALNEYK